MRLHLSIFILFFGTATLLSESVKAGAMVGSKSVDYFQYLNEVQNDTTGAEPIEIDWNDPDISLDALYEASLTYGDSDKFFHFFSGDQVLTVIEAKLTDGVNSVDLEIKDVGQNSFLVGGAPFPDDPAFFFQGASNSVELNRKSSLPEKHEDFFGGSGDQPTLSSLIRFGLSVKPGQDVNFNPDKLELFVAWNIREQASDGTTPNDSFSVDVESVPEPSTVGWALCLGVFGTVRVVRRRRDRASRH